jgi:hypothetical protein
VVLDMATTVAAYGKVKAKAQRGEQMPVGWMIDRTGQPLTDPKRADEGFLMPIGGYKGYGLALIVGLLAGTLNGAAMGSEVIDFNKDDTTITNTGQAILVIDPAAFGDLAAFKARVDKLVRELRASERMPGVDRIWLPGEQSHAQALATNATASRCRRPCAPQLDAFARELGIPTLQNRLKTGDTHAPTRRLAPGIRRQRAVHRRPRPGAVALRQADPHDRAAGRRQRRRQRGAHRGAEDGHRTSARPSCIENQPGAAGLMGAGQRGQGRARRLHAGRLQRQHHDHGAPHARQDALGHPEGLRAGVAGGHRRMGPGGAAESPDPHRGRPDRRRAQEGARRDQLRLGRQRQPAAHRDGAVRLAGRRADEARAVQGRDAGGDGRGRQGSGAAFQGIATVTSLVKAGKLRLIGVTTPRRMPQFPDVPTVSESGLPGFEFNSWFAIMAPAGTPKAHHAPLATEVQKALADPEVREKLNAQGLTPRGTSPEELGTATRAQFAKYGALIKAERHHGGLRPALVFRLEHRRRGGVQPILTLLQLILGHAPGFGPLLPAHRAGPGLQPQPAGLASSPSACSATGWPCRWPAT